MKALRFLLVGCLSLVALLLVGISALYFSQPTDFTVSRSRVIATTPERLHAQIDDLRAWAAWSSSAERADSETFSTPSSGLNASRERRFADGRVTRVTVTELSPARVVVANETSGGRLGGGSSTFTIGFAPAPGGTEVTLTVHGVLHGLPRLLWPFVHVEAGVGDDLEHALGQLEKTITAP